MGDAVKTDYAHKETDKIIEELEKKLQKEYQQASKEVEAKMNDYLKRFQTKDKTADEVSKDNTEETGIDLGLIAKEYSQRNRADDKCTQHVFSSWSIPSRYAGRS